jgi:hypothetical protein
MAKAEGISKVEKAKNDLGRASVGFIVGAACSTPPHATQLRAALLAAQWIANYFHSGAHEWEAASTLSQTSDIDSRRVNYSYGSSNTQPSARPTQHTCEW